jgi:aldehyde:ferredoxin oxidoreductase
MPIPVGISDPITDERIKIEDASDLWGLDTVETEEAIQQATGDKKTRIACIGPASEKISLISGIVNDRGRVAARSGVGAVMGAKKLKAVAVRGSGKLSIADKDTLDRLRKNFIKEMRDMPGMPQALMKHGTCGFTESLVACVNIRPASTPAQTVRSPAAAYLTSHRVNTPLVRPINPSMKPSAPSAPCACVMISSRSSS